MAKFFYTGVDFFFVISGFIFAPAKEAAGAFAVKRFFRIYPLYLTAIIFYALLPGNVWDNSIISQHALFLHTSLSKEIAFFYNPAFWSLPVEIEFYLLIMLLVLFKIRETKYLFFFFFCMSLLSSVFVHYFLATDSHLKLVLTHHLLLIFPEFFLGTLAY